MTNDEVLQELLESYGLASTELEAIDALLGDQRPDGSFPHFSDTMIAQRVAEAARVLDSVVRDELAHKDSALGS